MTFNLKSKIRNPKLKGLTPDTLLVPENQKIETKIRWNFKVFHY
jgi:hypothetical protein